MSLLDIKKSVIKRSGRVDLVVDLSAYVDNGVNDFINAGMRWLDRRIVTPKSLARYQKDTVAGDTKLYIPNCRAIKEVWAFSSVTLERWKLEKYPLEELRAYYPESITVSTQGAPLYYAPAVMGLAPAQAGLTAVGGASPYTAQFTYDWEDLYFGNHYAYNGIIWFPPADTIYTMEIWAYFYSKVLAADADVNFWTEVHPDILVDAALMMVDASTRNSEGVNDWLKVLEMKLVGVDQDMAEQEVVGDGDGEGSMEPTSDY